MQLWMTDLAVRHILSGLGYPDRVSEAAVIGSGPHPNMTSMTVDVSAAHDDRSLVFAVRGLVDISCSPHCINLDGAS